MKTVLALKVDSAAFLVIFRARDEGRPFRARHLRSAARTLLAHPDCVGSYHGFRVALPAQ